MKRFTTSNIPRSSRQLLWSSLKQPLPFFDTQVSSFVALLVRYPTGQRVCGVGHLLDKPSKAPQTVVDGCFGLRVFFRSTSTAFSVRPGSFVGVVGLAFGFCGPLARIFQIDTRYVAKCPTIANLPEGTVQACARNFMKCPAVGELPGGDDHALTRGFHLVLQTFLVLLGLVELLHGLVCYPEQHVALGLFRHFLHSLFQDLVLLRQVVKGVKSLLVKIIHLGIRIGILLVCGAEAPFPIVKEPVHISHSHTNFLCSFFPSLSLIFSFQRRAFGVVCAFILARITANTPLAPSRKAAFRGLVFVRGWCASFVVPRC